MKQFWAILLLGVGGCAASSAQPPGKNATRAVGSAAGNVIGNAVSRPAPPVPHPKNVVVRPRYFVHANMGELAVEPSLAFIEMGVLVRSYKTTPKLRVTSYQMALGAQSSLTSLYNRRAHTLTIFGTDEDASGARTSSELYINVTDNVLLKATAPTAATQLGKPWWETNYGDIPTFGAFLKSRHEEFKLPR